MESCHMSEVNIENVFYFGSGARGEARVLSNFFQCRVEYKGVVYPSAEHAFQAQRVPEQHRHMFAKDGVLANWEEGFRLLLPPPQRARSQEQLAKYEATLLKKVEYWSSRGSLPMIGIMAKMAVHDGRVGRLFGGGLLELTFEQCQDILIDILTKKYELVGCREVLLSTGKRMLVEHARFQKAERSEPTRWGGKVVEGVLYGHNQMGSLLMHIRDSITRDTAH